MAMFALNLMCIFFFIGFVVAAPTSNCSIHGTCEFSHPCSYDKDCAPGRFCDNCPILSKKERTCTRKRAYMPTSIRDDLHFNDYTWLVTHDSFCSFSAPNYPGLVRNGVFYTQEDNITNQLANGVRGFMIEMYHFKYNLKYDIWLCHGTFGGRCDNSTAFAPAVDTLREVENFLRRNPTAIISIFIKDFIHTQDGVTNVFIDAGLQKYRLPISKMPKNGGDWPLISEMVKNNHRLLVFSSNQSKESTEGIAYQWRYIQETEPGFTGGQCTKRKESMELGSRNSSLFMINYYTYYPELDRSCADNGDVHYMVDICNKTSGILIPTFISVNYYMRSDGGGVFDLLDRLNANKLCGCDSISDCQAGLCNKQKNTASATQYSDILMTCFIYFLLCSFLV